MIFFAREAPVVDEVVPAQAALDHQDRILRDQRAVLLVDVLEHRDLEAAAAVVEHEAGASAALADLEHEARDGHVAARAAPRCPCPRSGADRLRAADVGDPPAGDRPQLALVLGDRMAGEIEAERLALAREPDGLAPVGQRLVQASASGVAAARAPAARRPPAPRARTGRPAPPPAPRVDWSAACIAPAAGASASRGSHAAQRVERAGADQRLEHATVDLVQVEPAAEVAQVAETARRASRSASMFSTAACPTPLIAPSP